MPTINKQPYPVNSLFLSAAEIQDGMISSKYKFTPSVNRAQSIMFPEYKQKGFNPLFLKPGVTLNDLKPKEKKEENEVTVPTPTDKKGISTVTGANIATGINTIANVAASLYGAKMASKMQPSLISKPADIEPVLITDKTSAIESAGKENIEKSGNTTRYSYREAGLTGMDGVLLSKENEALNQLSGQLAQYRTNIDAQNAQTTNQVNQVNAATALNVDQANANTINQFDQYKSSLIGSGIQNASENLRAGTESIFGNMMASAHMNILSINAELETLSEALKAPITENKNLIAQKERYAELIRQKQEIENSAFGKPYLKK